MNRKMILGFGFLSPFIIILVYRMMYVISSLTWDAEAGHNAIAAATWGGIFCFVTSCTILSVWES